MKRWEIHKYGANCISYIRFLDDMDVVWIFVSHIIPTATILEGFWRKRRGGGVEISKVPKPLIILYIYCFKSTSIRIP